MAFIFPCIGNFIIPTDEVIFFRGVGSTTNQFWVYSVNFMGFEKGYKSYKRILPSISIVGKNRALDLNQLFLADFC
jgi:hypothetical protein